jgi:predicted nucleotidyltransferase
METEGHLATRREEYTRALERALTDLVAQLRAMPAVQQVILFGSYAAGRRDLFTDLDVLVIMDSDLDFVPRNAALYQQLSVEVEVDLDLLAYTPEEVERMRERGLVRRALATGQVLYAKNVTG